MDVFTTIVQTCKKLGTSSYQFFRQFLTCEKSALDRIFPLIVTVSVFATLYAGTGLRSSVNFFLVYTFAPVYGNASGILISAESSRLCIDARGIGT
jgi:hypothetical protein